MQVSVLKWRIFKSVIALMLVGESITPAVARQEIELTLAQPLLIAQQSAQTAVELVNQGLQLIQQRKMQQAIAAFRQATELDAKLAPAHYNLGLALRQVGQLQLAANAFYQATQADAKFALAYANLGAALLEGSNPNLAEDYLQQALKLDSKLGLAHYNLGLVKEQQQEWDSAIASYKKAIKYSATPENPYNIKKIYKQKSKDKK